MLLCGFRIKQRCWLVTIHRLWWSVFLGLGLKRNSNSERRALKRGSGKKFSRMVRLFCHEGMLKIHCCEGKEIGSGLIDFNPWSCGPLSLFSLCSKPRTAAD